MNPAPQQNVYVIAEAGVNHNGSIELARQLIDVAAEAGADAVKFQTFKASSLVTKTAAKAEYQKRNTDAEASQFEMLKKLELSEDMHHELLAHANSVGIQFLSTGFDNESLDFLHGLGMPLFKIPSGEITNYPLIEKVASFNKPTIFSTGMATMEEIEACLTLLKTKGVDRSRITILHCNTQYPTPMCDVNLSAMQTIGQQFPDVQVGYSDHTLGIEIPIAAVAMGAKVIEKHFTLDSQMDGPDHAASLEPAELKQMMLGIRNIEQALGDGIKKPSPSELPNVTIARKSLVAARTIEAGEVFSEENLTAKRPGGGRSPMDWPTVIGSVATRAYAADEKID